MLLVHGVGDACARFFIGEQQKPNSKGEGCKVKDESHAQQRSLPSSSFRLHPSALPRVSQIVSLTGFSFVGGPAMNDSEAAVEFLRELNVPLRSAVSLDVQTVEAWRDSWTGLNPVQAGMQVAIPEIDGATEPFVYGGMTAEGVEPVALEERCRRLARRLSRWNRLQTAERSKSLGRTKNLFALARVGKEFGQPGDGGDKFHAHSDESRAA